MTLADKMNRLIETLKTKGVGGVQFPMIKPYCPEDWSADYAVAWDAFRVTEDMPFFDKDAFREEFFKTIREHFAEPGVEIHVWDTTPPTDERMRMKDGSLYVRYYAGTHELEVIRNN